MTGTALLEVSALSVHYPRGRGQAPLVALSDVDLSIAEGETVSVVGESGSGKSKIGRAHV